MVWNRTMNDIDLDLLLRFFLNDDKLVTIATNYWLILANLGLAKSGLQHLFFIFLIYFYLIFI